MIFIFFVLIGLVGGAMFGLLGGVWMSLALITGMPMPAHDQIAGLIGLGFCGGTLVSAALVGIQTIVEDWRAE
jgi:hypothetical protein